MKSSYYVATVVNAYRRALDMLPKPPTKELCEELMKASHRRYTTGFYLNDPEKHCTEDSMPVQESEFVAIVSQDTKDGFVELEMRNKFSVGEELEILSPNEKLFNKKFKVLSIKNSAGEEVDSAKVVQEKVVVPCRLPLKAGDVLRR